MLTYRIQRYLITPHYSQINFLLRFSYSPLNLQLCIFPRVFSTRHFPRLSVQRGRQRQRNIEYPEDGQQISLFLTEFERAKNLLFHSSRSACVSLFRRHAFPYFNGSFNRDTRSEQRRRVALTENQIVRRLDPLFDRTHPFSQAGRVADLSLSLSRATVKRRFRGLDTEVADFIVRLLITSVSQRRRDHMLDKTGLAECEMQNRRCALLLEHSTGTLCRRSTRDILKRPLQASGLMI